MRLWLSRARRASPAWMDAAWSRRVAHAAAGLPPRAGVVNVVIVDDREIRRLNRRYRGQNRATDVLSFSYADAARRAGDVIGDVFVSHQTLARDARREGLAPGDLALRIVLHGVLHVIGYDHATGAEAARMERRERAVLRRVLPERVVRGLF